ncbi:MAG: hypothetical protein ACR2IE_14110 [Candidatus Sumerlaeaceae bacterium]
MRTNRTTALPRITAAAAAALFLAGCSSRDAMDYLPEMPAYLAFNADHARSTAGGQRLLEAASKMQPEAASLMQGKLKKLYVGVDSPGAPGAHGAGQRPAGGGCAVAIGDGGFAKYASDQFRLHGATEQKMSGRKVLTSGTISLCPVGDNGVIVFSRAQDLDKMLRTSQKKNPSARQSAPFKTTEALAASHAFVMVTDWSQVLSLIGNQLNQVTALSPKGVEALKQVRAASVAMDWDEQPLVQATLHLPNAEGRDDLAGLVNIAMGLAGRMKPKGADPKLLSMLDDLKAETSEEGVTIKLTVPKETADAWLSKAAR